MLRFLQQKEKTFQETSVYEAATLMSKKKRFRKSSNNLVLLLQILCSITEHHLLPSKGNTEVLFTGNLQQYIV